ncbi:MAG: ABC transporter permease [Chloroflexi bacterium]|nr:ABC transporter permease [Chloroflexota bacterium]
MIHRLVTRDNVAITGSVIGLSSLIFGWLTLKPNRLAAGTSLSLWDATGWGGTAIIFILWLICFILSLRGKEKRPAAALGISANLLIIITLALAGLIASQLRQGETSSARVALDSGIWFSLAGAYMVIFATRQRLTDWPVWRNLVSWTGLSVIVVMLITGWLHDLSILQEFAGRQERFVQELVQHVILFSGSVTVGALLGIPLGIWAARSKRVAGPVFFITGITQTMPSLALFGLLIAPLSALSFAFPILREFGIRGVGATPAIIALVIYSLLPIVRNTFVSLNQIDPAAIDAGLGMGMSRFQLFRRVEIPLATPLVLEGVRTASVQAVGNTAVAALIGAGGLGWFIFQGLGQAAADLIILGAIPIIVIALLVDTLMRNIVSLATPKGLTGGNQ